MAGDLAGAPMPPGAAPQGLGAQGAGSNGDQAVQTVPGGISLAMSECDVVRRAGLASNVTIGVGNNNQRKVVLTYLGGTWPGIYTFYSGRLKDISRVPEQDKPAPKKKSKRTAKKKQGAR